MLIYHVLFFLFQPNRSVFSGFSGFNKTQKTSFDFLAKLTNGNKPNNSTSTTKNDVAETSTTDTNKPTTSPSRGLFSLSGTSTPLPKSTFGKPNTEAPLFGNIPTTFSQSIFTPQPNATVNASPFKIQTTQNPLSGNDLASKPSDNAEKSVSQGSSTIFGTSPVGNTSSKSLFTTPSNNISPFKTQHASSSQTSDNSKTVKKTDTVEEKRLVYYNKLKGLNQSVSAWIKKHVEETPLCILTPIFKDYEKHLSEIQDEYEKSKNQFSKENTESKENNVNKNLLTQSNNNIESPFTATKLSAISSNISNNTVEKSSNFTFGISTTSAASSTSSFPTSTSSAGFSFGVKPSTPQTSPFASSTAIGSPSKAPFSFGTGKPFTFNSNIQKPEEPSQQTEENEDEPPKVEYTPIVEDNSVFDKKCKVFVKKDGNFVDKGVGTLYIKKVEESGKFQLLVRANTSLGNILLNFILSASITMQRMGKNNVMMVCIPTPDAQPPPTPILIRVKASEEADELLETLNKYKV